jgi:YbbR domain-containing protein
MWRRLYTHLGLKILAVTLAILLWVVIAGQKQGERSLRVPLEFQNTPEQLELTSNPPEYVDVRVRGPARTLAQLRSGDVVALVDLESARPGRRMFHIMQEHVYVPPGVRVLLVQPSTIPLQFEPSVSKTVPVAPMTDGEPASGFMLGRVVSNPDKVDVVGPESAMREVTQATTEPVSIAGATGRVTDIVTIGLAHPAARLRVPRTATVTVDIWPAPVTRDIADVPLGVRNPARGVRVRVEPSTVAVTVRGAGTLVRALEPRVVPAWVDVARLRRGNYNLRVHVDAQGQFEVVDVRPNTVRVRID